MSEPLIIYECPSDDCSWDGAFTPLVVEASLVCPLCRREMVPIRVFREEDVRPLWGALTEIAGHNYSGWAGGVPDAIATPALEGFGAPEDWSA